MKTFVKYVVLALFVGGCEMVVAPAGIADAPPVIAPSVAIIDSGINTALFSGSIVDEVCILEYSLCPNGKSLMDGPGAANTGLQTNATLTHGNEMASIITKVNSAIKIIPIRIVGITDKGNPYIYSNNAVKQGLDWVVANRVKYNIQAVNVSQGKIFAGCTLPVGTQTDIDALRAANVAVIAATGNDSNRGAVMSIACAPGVIAIGATDNPDPGSSGKSYSPSAKPCLAPGGVEMHILSQCPLVCLATRWKAEVHAWNFYCNCRFHRLVHPELQGLDRRYVPISGEYGDNGIQ